VLNLFKADKKEQLINAWAGKAENPKIVVKREQFKQK
jgi:hypothetical protein